MRDQILDAMRGYGKPISPKQLSQITGTPLNPLSHHVRALRNAGYIKVERELQVRGALQHFYELAVDPADAPLTDPLVTMLGLCECLTLPTGSDGYPEAVVLDAQAREELQQLLEQLKPRVRKVATAIQRRS